MNTAREPITITISHRLGRAEAKRRIDGGLAAIRRDIAQFVSTLDSRWEGDRLEFRAVAMRQAIDGRIEVFDDSIRVALNLPLLLHLLARPIAGRVEQRAANLLAPPADKS